MNLCTRLLFIKNILLTFLIFTIVSIPSKLVASYDFATHFIQTNKDSKLVVSPTIVAGYTFAKKEDPGLQFFIRASYNPIFFWDNLFSDLFKWLDDEKTFYQYNIYAGGGLKYQHPLSRDLFLTTEAALYFFSLETISSQSHQDIFSAPMFGLGAQHSLTGVSLMLHYLPYNKRFGTLKRDRYMLTFGISF